MKTIVSTIVFFIFFSVKPVWLQAQDCKEMQERMDQLQKRLEKIENLKLNYEDFFSLMDDPNSTDGGIAEEIANCEHRIDWLGQKIAGGDRSAETAAELNSARTRLDLLNLRSNPRNNKNALLKDPRYLAQQTNMKNLSTDQYDVKLEMANLGLTMKNSNCPVINKNTGDIDDLLNDGTKPKVITTDNTTTTTKTTTKTTTTTTTKVPGTFAGNWKYTDTRNTEGMTMTLDLNGSGTSVTGAMSFGPPDMPAKYTVYGCIENGENRLRCSYTGVMEDYEKYIDSKGTVDLNVNGNSLKANWADLAAPTVRWKPGHESTIKRVSGPRSFEVPFTK